MDTPIYLNGCNTKEPLYVWNEKEEKQQYKWDIHVYVIHDILSYVLFTFD